jgi:hypothetical protein
MKNPPICAHRTQTAGPDAGVASTALPDNRLFQRQQKDISILLGSEDRPNVHGREKG